MKRTFIQPEGIGATINRFETMELQNIETFNELFPNCKLTGFDSDLSVTIGDYNNGRRNVTINDNIQLEHVFSHIDYTMGYRISKMFLLSHSDGTFIGKFNTWSEAADLLDLTTNALRNGIIKKRYIFQELTNE